MRTTAAQMASQAGASAAVLGENSLLRRFGVKGPRAAAWLQQYGIALPEVANSWKELGCLDTDQDIVVRLGSNEYFIEHASGTTSLVSLAQQLAEPAAGVYPVLREDRALVLSGEGATAVLAETCNVNFDELPLMAAVMTMMVGVAVVVVPQGNAAQRRYRIWCDPSFGDYLWSTLQRVVRDVCNRKWE